jgi:2-polyprenyl-3-methyl-5-hydroxy-6-metoxy-1,4-benzoquinol methylase
MKLKNKGQTVTFEDATKTGKLSVYTCVIEGKNYPALAGDDAVWVDMGDTGLKFIPEANQADRFELYEDNIKLQELESSAFPLIHSVVNNNELGCVIVEMDRVERGKTSNMNKTTAIQEFYDHHLLPEDEWYKKTNMMGDKIVDFHRFQIMHSRYEFYCRCHSDELKKLYKTALKKYQARGDNKWKGKIYQGMTLVGDDGVHVPFEGYTSNGNLWDSYRKLPFCYMNKVSGKKVLDIGCNQGFFSVQASLHGAAQVDSIELCNEDIWLAKQIAEKADILVQPTFYEGDATKIINKLGSGYEVSFLLSVLHQIFPQFKGADSFLKTLAEKSNHVIFETPINHPLMKTDMRGVRTHLSKYFREARHMYTYNAYSSGDRAIFACYK